MGGDDAGPAVAVIVNDWHNAAIGAGARFIDLEPHLTEGRSIVPTGQRQTPKPKTQNETLAQHQDRRARCLCAERARHCR